MTQTIKCKKLGIEAEKFTTPPYPGPLGERIMQEISQPGFELWKKHQVLLINEYRLNLADPVSRQFLMEEMKKFLFGTGSEKPHGFKEQC